MAVICAFLDKNARINKDSVGNAVKTIKILLDTVSSFSTPFRFKQTDTEGLVNIVIGEIGTGKSTL